MVDLADAFPVRRTGAIAGAVTIPLYLLDGNRGLDYDSAVTVSRFIRTPSVWDPLHRQAAFNNHVLFSFLERLVVWATGRSDPATLRVLPILFGAAFVVLVVSTTEVWLGRRPALIAAVVIIANPMFIEEI